MDERWRHHRSPPPQFRHETEGEGNILQSPALVISAHKTFEPTDLTSTYSANLEADSDGIQELLDSHNRQLTMDELIEMHEQDMEELDSLDPIQSEDRMIVCWEFRRRRRFN
ncbi:hypothetical protein TNCV_3274461 [Trichonephila clavipes]|nr:hypothetical protein TNCV_3274461 [Trichonephila clavipes]